MPIFYFYNQKNISKNMFLLFLNPYSTSYVTIAITLSFLTVCI